MDEKQIVIRVGEPRALRELDQYVRKETSAYFLDLEDMVFIGITIMHEDFVNAKDSNDPVFQEHVYCNNWKLVESIDAPIYLRTKTDGDSFQEEKWEEIGEAELKSLGLLLAGIVERYPALEDLRGYWTRKNRELTLKNIGL